MEKKHPALAILVGNALSKAGMKKSPRDKEDDEESEKYSEDDTKEHLKEIASDMLKAIEEKDSDVLAELLEEAFECLEMSPHKEGEHLGE